LTRPGSVAPVIRDAHVVLATDRFDDDLKALTDQHGFRIDAIYPADSPSTAIVSAYGVRLRLESCAASRPVTLHLISDDDHGGRALPGGSTIEFRPFTTTYELPGSVPSLVISHDDGESGVGRAGMRYRDLIPDRWGGAFVASHITIPDGGPIPDYVHFHKVRFQMIFVKSGWVRLVYEDQGEPFVMVAGDCVLQPPEIRHRVLESSPGLEVIEIGCPALHETIADWALPLPNVAGDAARRWDGQSFVRHVAADAEHRPWTIDGWVARDTGIGDATNGLAGARVARPEGTVDASQAAVDVAGEFAMLVVLGGAVTFESDGRSTRLRESSSVAIPAGTSYRLREPTADCELLDVTLPA
jgi:mannose-6-phosphate isomerase-like protein (cupin superfamily)